MNLSRIILNPANKDARRDAAFPYELHRTLKRAFPGGENQRNRLLFRIEHEFFKGGVPVLVQCSHQLPDWDYVREMKSYSLAIDGPKKIDLNLTPGTCLAFRLVANPTKKIKENGKRQGLSTALEQIAWLERKGKNGGFQPITTGAIVLNTRSGTAKFTKRDIPHLAVQFDGELIVTDPEIFRATMYSGIGSAKGFGFGMLSIAKAPRST